MSSSGNFFSRRFIEVRAHEAKATIVSFLFLFVLMASYYVMHPSRDAIASEWGDAEVSLLWTISFALSFVVVILYGYVISNVKFRYALPAVYGFFAASFLLFYLYFHFFSSDRALVDKVFYVWLSVFSLFHVSVFWSFMADIFSKGQAKRLFDAIAAGASAGALVGPAIPTLLAPNLGTDTLILLAAVMLIVPVFMVMYLNRLKHTELHNDNVHADLSQMKIGGGSFAGFKLFLANPYLLGIAAFIFLYTGIDSFVYFEQKNLLAVYDRTTRTQILGGIDWITNILTFGLAFFASGRMVHKAGMGLTLASLPLLTMVSFLALAFAPMVWVLVVLQVARRSGNYSVVRPAREMLFTEVDRESRFKAKPVIDIVVYRGGNMLSGWLFAGLTTGLGLGMVSMALVGAVIAAGWCACGLLLGKRFEASSQAQTEPQTINQELLEEQVHNQV
ncbi:MAG TPA: MFS transporter [Candidatus Acidoferrum sp.]|nr:MFS transporter [Candidatus Acidoferrum sp.]